ncbi:GNAT family N-acetyltransferase [Paenibacillus turpanensis]|uniref:GNAT family N-acetyltransferase n=1 Tax=Paenibacillus turpanensis TaxID=2689078 RepID=UPI00140E63E0|nr:GNAT family N-acetyltransferase [Paenibacillus turpanensis]
MNSIIREAILSDYHEVARLVAQIHEIHVKERPDIYAPDPCPMSNDYFNKLLVDQKSKLFVVVVEDKVVGYSVLRINLPPNRQIYRSRKYISIDDFCIDEKYRNNGLGKELMNYILDFGKGVSAQCIELGVSEFNKDAIRFYESMGLTTRSRRMEFILRDQLEDGDNIR